MRRMPHRVLKKISVLVVWCLGVVPVIAQGNSDIVETGRLLATLLDAGRVTVGLNQTSINDPSKGHKGFTPEVFRKQMLALKWTPKMVQRKENYK